MKSCVNCKYNNGVAVVGNKDEPCYSCLTSLVDSLPNYEMKEELEDWKPTKITNAERIRFMNNTELVGVLLDFQCKCCDFDGFCKSKGKCKKSIMEWLKEEVSE